VKLEVSAYMNILRKTGDEGASTGKVFDDFTGLQPFSYV
jgi:hypothetical protein